MAMMEEKGTLSSKKKGSGLGYLILLALACFLVAFLFLVAGNVVGAIISVALGIITSR